MDEKEEKGGGMRGRKEENIVTNSGKTILFPLQTSSNKTNSSFWPFAGTPLSGPPRLTILETRGWALAWESQIVEENQSERSGHPNRRLYILQLPHIEGDLAISADCRQPVSCFALVGEKF